MCLSLAICYCLSCSICRSLSFIFYRYCFLFSSTSL